MGAALVGVDGVRERVDRLRVTGVPLHRDLEFVAGALRGETDDGVVDRLLRAVDVPHVVLEAARVVVDAGLHLVHGRRTRLGGLVLGGLRRVRDLADDLFGDLGVADALVGEGDRQALVEEGHLLEAARDRLEAVDRGLEDVRVGPERDRGARLLGGLALDEFTRLRVGVGLVPLEAVALDVDVEPGGQRVDDGDTDTVQTAGHGVGVGVELAAGVELGEDDLDGGDTGGVHPDGDASTVVDDLDATVFEEGDLDLAGVAGHGLVDGVVDDFPDQVVETAFTGGTDVHTRSLTNGFESLEDGDGRSAVVLAGGAFV